MCISLSCLDSVEPCKWYSVPLKAAQVVRHLTIGGVGSRTVWLPVRGGIKFIGGLRELLARMTLWFYRRNVRRKNLAIKRRGANNMKLIEWMKRGKKLLILKITPWPFAYGVEAAGSAYSANSAGNRNRVLTSWTICEKSTRKTVQHLS